MDIPAAVRTESRLAAWWSAWKYVAILAVLLVASVGLNLRQWSDHRTYKATEALALENAANKAGLQVSAALAAKRGKDSKELLDDLATLVERGRKVKRVYSGAAAARPLGPGCAPGKARMDAVNADADP